MYIEMRDISQSPKLIDSYKASNKNCTFEKGTQINLETPEVINFSSGEFVKGEDVYIGRGSKWGNPFRLGRYNTREQSIKKYRNYIMNRKDLLKDIKWLGGKKLGCYCKPLACHGDILVELFKERIWESVDVTSCHPLKERYSAEGFDKLNCFRDTEQVYYSKKDTSYSFSTLGRSAEHEERRFLNRLASASPKDRLKLIENQGNVGGVK